MRLPSLHRIAGDLRGVFTRFPLEVLIAATGTGAAMLMVQFHRHLQDEDLIRVLMTCLLGLPAALACTLYGERRGLSRGVRVAMYAVLVALLLVYGFSLRNMQQAVHPYRFAGLFVAVHAAVAVVGFLQVGQSGGFWEFNKTLFLRICTAAIFSGVLFAGLAGALAAVDALFAVRVREQVYAQLFFFIAGIFNTVFFLAGVPRPEQADEARTPYPRVLRLFIQFVLVPLVSLYLLILLAYEVKIIAQWHLPKGWVSNLVLAYGVAGILTILLAYPIRHTEGSRWVRLFSQWFFALLLPLVALMLVAIWQRIHTYGFTEERYFVLALGVWLGGMALYFLLRRDRADIRAIPASLMVLGLLSVIGPWSAPAVSVSSQRGRLKKLLAANGMLQNGKAVPAKDSLSFEASKGMCSAIEYLLEHRGPAGLEPLIPMDSVKDASGTGYSTDAHVVARRLNIRYVNRWSDNEYETDYAGLYVAYRRDMKAPVDIRGYDYCIPMQRYYEGTDEATDAQPRYRVEQHTIQRDTAYDRLELLILNSAGDTVAGPVAADSLFEALLSRHPDDGSLRKALPNDTMSLSGAGRGVEYRFVFDKLEGYRGQREHGAGVSYDGLVLIREVR